MFWKFINDVTIYYKCSKIVFRKKNYQNCAQSFFTLTVNLNNLVTTMFSLQFLFKLSSLNFCSVTVISLTKLTFSACHLLSWPDFQLTV